MEQVGGARDDGGQERLHFGTELNVIIGFETGRMERREEQAPVN